MQVIHFDILQAALLLAYSLGKSFLRSLHALPFHLLLCLPMTGPLALLALGWQKVDEFALGTIFEAGLVWD